MKQITQENMDYINEEPQRLFTTDVGKEIMESGMAFFSDAARWGASTVRIPELRDVIDRAVRQDILRQSYALMANMGALACMAAIIRDSSMELAHQRVKLNFLTLFIKCYEDEESLRRLCTAVIDYHLPNFQEICKERYKDGF